MIYPRLSDGTIDWCVMCKHEGRSIFDGCCECEYTENSDDPPTKYEPKPMTNSDRIRSMSDEELAEFCVWMCPPGSNENLTCEPERKLCSRCWLDWLTKEVRS